ncbi:MAG: RHS repeat-associated core domain-containing protein [Deltaproteobacteria bacterium]
MVTHDRDLAARLLGLTVAGTGQGASLYDVGTFATAERPGTVTLGNTVERLDVYDDRRRLTERSYRRSDGSLVASFRYAYDAANRELGRLDAHRGGRANVYTYLAERLATADLGARALVSGSGFGVADVQFTYTYESSGEDRLTSVGTQVPVGDTAPAVAQSYTVYDTMGHASEIDGVTRARDAHGNVESTQSVHGLLQLDYDVRNRLRRVDRPDGSSVQYTYRADDVLLERQVTCAATVVEPCRDSHRLYVYDGLLLLQEYEAGSPPSLRAQYYYADEGDVPFAADLWHEVNQRLERYYYIVDRMGSITGLMDASGAVVERIDYTVWGEPEITTQDTLAPSIASVRGDGTGDLLVTFTEPVDPALVSVAETGLGVTVTDLTSELTVTANLGGALSVTSVAVEPDATVAYGTTYRVTAPGLSVGSTYVVALAADAVQDPWGNGNAAESVSLAYTDAAAAAVAAGPGNGVVTAPVVVERSVVGNTLGFQAHLHDWDVDLVLMRARVFEPRTGMFLQRDPNGYEDSVNLYAGMRWDPVNLRDPTGRETKEYQECVSDPHRDADYCQQMFGDLEAVPSAWDRVKGAASWVWNKIPSYRQMSHAIVSRVGSGVRSSAPRLGRLGGGIDANRAYRDQRVMAADVHAVQEHGATNDLAVTAEGIETGTMVANAPSIIRGAASGGVVLGVLLERGLKAAKNKVLRRRIAKYVTEELGENLNEVEWFLHGTTADAAANFAARRGDTLYTTLDPEKAMIWADRTARDKGGRTGAAILILPKDVVRQMRADGKLQRVTRKDVGWVQFEFDKGAVEDIERHGFFADVSELFR